MLKPKNYAVRKKLILDASSAILLYKARLHSIWVETYFVIMPESVFEELTVYNRPGGKEYFQLCINGQIAVEKVTKNLVGADSTLFRMGRGERDCLILFGQGKADFVVTDDGPAAKYCNAKSIPFINALLVPPILQFAGIKCSVDIARAYQILRSGGRYSNRIKSYADSISKKDLEMFFPV